MSSKTLSFPIFLGVYDMSTRSQIRFVEKFDGRNNKAQVYRHSDGYPDGVINDLRRLKKLLKETRTERGASYTASNFILLGKLDVMKYYLDSFNVGGPKGLVELSNHHDIDQAGYLLGYGVEEPLTGIHGDEEWIYEVEVGNQWHVKVSNSWSDREKAFETADWDFEGTLEEVYEHYTSPD